MPADGGRKGIDETLQQVLVDAAMFVEKSKAGLEAMHQQLQFLGRQAFEVDAGHAVHHADVTGLRQERRVVDEAPERQQRIDAAGVRVVA